MKRAPIFAVCLLWLNFSTKACSVVEVVEYLRSTQKASIEVTLDGNPVKDVKIVVISSADGRTHATLLTDSEGSVVLPSLPAGKYCLSAATTPTVRSDVCLEISNVRTGKRSHFPMMLHPQPPPPPTLDEKIQMVWQAAVSEHVSGFSGVVQDPTGATIPATKIRVFSKSSGTERPVATLVTDRDGHFETVLPEGEYAAVFEFGGFQTQIVSFEIAKSATEKSLTVKLKLGLCS